MACDPDWLGSRKVGTKATDPTVEVEGTSYEFAVEVGVDDDLPNGAYAIPNFTPPHAIHFGTQKVFVPASGATYNDVVRPMMSKLREKIDAWFQTLVGQVDASNNANAFSIKASRYATENGGGGGDPFATLGDAAVPQVRHGLLRVAAEPGGHVHLELAVARREGGTHQPLQRTLGRREL